MSCLLATSMFFAAGCNDKDNPDNPSNSVPDPEGTMITNIRNDTHQQWTGSCFCGAYYGLANVGIGTLSMSASNTFGSFGSTGESIPYGAFEIAYIGTVNGLGSIKSIPKENLFTGGGCAIIENGGYVLRGTTGTYNQGEYARLYVTHFLTSGGGIVGAEIKYQYPFVP